MSIDMHTLLCLYTYMFYVYRHRYRYDKKTYTKVIVSIDMKVIMSIHIITASLSTTRLAELGGEGGWGTTQTKSCVGERDGRWQGGGAAGNDWLRLSRLLSWRRLRLLREEGDQAVKDPIYIRKDQEGLRIEGVCGT